jgi:hypothetical protein
MRDGTKLLHVLLLAAMHARAFAGEFSFVIVRTSNAPRAVGCMPASYSKRGADVDLPLVLADPVDGCTPMSTGAAGDAYCLVVLRG